MVKKSFFFVSVTVSLHTETFIRYLLLMITINNVIITSNFNITIKINVKNNYVEYVQHITAVYKAPRCMESRYYDAKC